LNAGVDTNLNAGTYYIVVDGVANINLSDYGSVGSYALAGSISLVLPIHNFILKGKNVDGMHELNWSYKADEPIKKIQIEISKDGRRFSTLAELPAEATHFSWKPLDNNAGYYRVKAITVADERSYYSNIETIRTVQGKTLDILSTIVSSTININSKGNYAYQLMDETGRLMQKGTLRAGSNAIDIRNSRKGLLLLRVMDGEETTVHKLIRQ
jgi:hypothetical protein